MWHTGEGMGWWMVFMGIFWVLFWGSLIYLFVVAVVRPGRETPGRTDAMEIAKQRYARGEISAEQLQEIKRDLEAL